MSDNRNQHEVQQENSELLDRNLNEILKHGRKIFTGNCDEKGNPIYAFVPASAADLAQARNRSKDLNMTSAPVSGTPAGDLVARAELKFKGKAVNPLPPVSEADDDAAPHASAAS